MRISDSVNPRDGAPYRIYALHLDEGDILRVVVESADLSPAISLFGPDGTLIGSSEVQRRSTSAAAVSSPYDYGYGHHHGYGYGHFGVYHDAHHQHDGVSGRKSLIRRASEPGRYLLVVSGLVAGEYGSFQLSTETVEPTAHFVFPGKATGFLYDGGRIHPHSGGLLNVYPLHLSAATAVEFSASSRDFTPQVSIVEAESERVLVTSPHQFSGGSAHLLTELPAGQYEVWVTASKDGRYTLDARPGQIERTASFEIGTPYRGFLGWNRDQIPSSFRRGESVSFELDEPAIFDVLMHSGDFNSYLVLTDAQDRVIVEDSDSGWVYNLHTHWYGGSPYQDARIFRVLQPGTYTLWATSVSEEESGAYRLTTTLREAPTRSEVRVGESVEGVLTQSSPHHPLHFMRTEYITLTVEEAGEVRIDLVNAEFDGHLILEDEWGQNLSESEHHYFAAATTQIRRALAAGTYRIAVTGISHNAFGSFTLRIQKAAPSGQQG